MEDWVTIRHIKKRNPQLGTREIAKLLCLSRNTVKRALGSTEPPEYKREKKVNPSIVPFVHYIYERLVVKRLQGSRVLEEIISKGYTGSKSAFYRHIGQLHDQSQRTFQPYETTPGEQMQFDWSEYTVTIDGLLTKVYVFGCILGFSRYRIYQASLSQTLGSVLEAMENSLIEIGGVTERIQTDNAKCFVRNASKENFQWNPNYLAFCGHYKIQPTRSLPAHPWSKGKVEKTFNFLEQHFIRERVFASFEDFLSKLKVFQAEVNNRIHATTKQTPLSLFQIEQSSLVDLPESRFVHVKELFRKATADCLVSFEGNRYSIPYQFALREVWLRISKGYILQIFSSGNALLAEHRISQEKGKTIMIMEHYKNHHIERGNWGRLAELFLKYFPGEEDFLEKLKAQKRNNPAYHLTQILDIVKYYHKDDCLKALKMAREYNVYHHKIIKGYLENKAGEILSGEDIISGSNSGILLPVQPDIKRPLKNYTLAVLTKTTLSEKDNKK